MKKVVFRIMGGHGIGYGHFFRSYSLAKAFKIFYPDLKVIFMINRELEDQFLDSEFEYLIIDSVSKDFDVVKNLNPQLFILDSYLLSNEYLLGMKRICKIMIFDDNNDVYDSNIPDILLNGNAHARDLNYTMNSNNLYLLGSKYLVMREEYWKEDTLEYEKKDEILITTGGTDSYDISYRLLVSLKDNPYKKKIIIGPGYKQDLIDKLEKINDENVELICKPRSLERYIKESKVAITAGGSTVYEVLSQKTIPIIFSIADNQDVICEYLERKGVLYIGKYPEIKYNAIDENIMTLMQENTYCHNDIFIIEDGQGTTRIIEAICQFNNIWE